MARRFPLVACAALALAAQGGAALAQQSIYINQIDPTAATAPRRTSSWSSNSDQYLLNSSLGLLPAGGSQTPTPNGATAAGILTGAANGLGPAQTNNLAVITQAGAGNTGTLAQNGFGNGGTIGQVGQNNTASATVNGNNNRTVQNQSGDSNASELLIARGDQNLVVTTQAAGNNNAADYSINGDRNSVVSNQFGSNLSYGLSIVGSDKNITVTQTRIGTSSPTAATGLSTGSGSAIPATSRR